MNKMKFTDWVFLIIFLALFFGGTIFLPAYCTYYTIAQNGFLAIGSLVMIVFTALISYLSLDFIVKEWKETA